MRRVLIGVFVSAAMLLGMSGRAMAATIGMVPNDDCLTYNGTLICDADVATTSTGTGVLEPFLRTAAGGNQSPSSGWNTATQKNEWEQPNDADQAWTSELAISSLSTVLIDNEAYVQFTVDINQEGKPGDDDSLLSLSHFQLYSCSTGSYNSLDGCTSFFNLFGGTVTYSADTKGNLRPVISDSQWVDFNYRNHTGSGDGDIAIYIPVEVFLGQGPYIALLDGWGQPGAFVDNDGFQEWIALQGISECPVGQDCDVDLPEPASLLLFGMAAVGSAFRMRRRRSAL